VISDEPIVFPDGYSPKNYDKQYRGEVALAMALVHSMNVPTVRLFDLMGMRRTLNIVRRFDYTNDRSGWKLRPEPSICLGTVDISPLELAAAYIPFVNHGVGVRPTFVRSIRDRKRQFVYLHKPNERVVLSPENAYILATMLREAVRQGTGRSTIGAHFKGREGVPDLFGKTGTTNDCREAWFTGFTPDLVLSVLIAFDQPRTLGPKMTGSKVVGPTWAAIMERVLNTRDRWKMHLTKPEDVAMCSICSRSGLLATEWCDEEVYRIGFRKDTQPRRRCDYH
jgi:penicillin-binding protein 1A